MAGAIGLAAAIDYLEAIGMDAIERHEQDLIAYVFPKLQAIEGLKILWLPRFSETFRGDFLQFRGFASS